MKMYVQFLLMWVVNSVIFYLAAMLVPDNYTLGNNLFTPLQAAVVSGLFLNMANWIVEPLANRLEWDMKPMPSLMMAYFAGNLVALWFIARYSMLTGFGVTSVLWVILLSVAMFIGQYAVVSVGMKKD